MSRPTLNLPGALLRKRSRIPDLSRIKAGECPAGMLLPFALEIPVRSYLNHAFPLSIVDQIAGCRPYLYESFIQVFFPHRKEDYDRFLMLPSLTVEGWEEMGLLRTRVIDTHSRGLSRPPALIELLTEGIADGYYAEIHIDEYFLPGRPCYGNTHSVHDNMIIGYEWPEKVFHVAGYGADYEVAPMGFEDVLRAFYHMPRNEMARRYLRLIKPRKTPSRPFDLEAVRRQLSDYLNSRASLTPRQMRRKPLYWKARRFTGEWGVQSYRALQDYLAEMSRQGRPLDLRATRTLWEHKSCMLERLRYLEEQGRFRDGRLFSFSYAPVESGARMLRFQAYQYNSGGFKREDLEEAAAQLQCMKETEAAVLSEVLDSLHPAGS